MVNLTKIVYTEAVKYLKKLGVKIPKHEVVFRDGYSGSYVYRSFYETKLVLGKYLTNRLRRRFVMHELIHVIASEKKLPDYCRNQEKISEKLPLHLLSGLPDIVRPRGFASWYAKLSDGEEALCELLGWVYSNGSFYKTVIPADLSESFKKALAWLRK
jgi:hypothetical protein